MSILILLMLGGALGWGAGALFPAAPKGLTVAAGMFGAILGGWLLAPLLGSGDLPAEGISGESLLQASLGAIVLIALVQLVRKGMNADEDE